MTLGTALGTTALAKVDGSLLPWSLQSHQRAQNPDETATCFAEWGRPKCRGAKGRRADRRRRPQESPEGGGLQVGLEGQGRLRRGQGEALGRGARAAWVWAVRTMPGRGGGSAHTHTPTHTPISYRCTDSGVHTAPQCKLLVPSQSLNFPICKFELDSAFGGAFWL